MRSLRYLNTVLTVLAVLLTVQIWTLWNAPPAPGSAPAPGSLASLDFASVAYAEGIPDAAQRQAMIDQLKLVNVKLADLANLLRSGELKVKLDGAQKVVDVAPAMSPAINEPVAPEGSASPTAPTAHPAPPVVVPQVMVEK